MAIKSIMICAGNQKDIVCRILFDLSRITLTDTIKGGSGAIRCPRSLKGTHYMLYVVVLQRTRDSDAMTYTRISNELTYILYELKHR